ncbi:hypothetical protein [Maribacter sp. 2210JD10-5]|uniref:hypothetical protein n=1 Tax=Maribacter sp. 2210JD10-5 TaxID=3386272 RepID=UPI0039BCC2C8
MKKIILGIGICTLALIGISASTNNPTSELTKDFAFGNPEISSINSLSFGPDGILFVGDSKNASIYALDTKDVEKIDKSEGIDMGEFDAKVAAALGTTADKIKINDMAVNPISKKIYFAINSMDGTPVLLSLSNGNFENISLKAIGYSQVELENAIAEDAKDKRGRPQRIWSISDIKYHKGKVLVSGLSNKEFASTFRSIPFPFKTVQDQASLEIWHAAHGQYETHAPIKTFDVITMDNTEYLMASYTCTPLVLFPMSDLKDGVHTKGRTVAELGAGNSPLDMISYEKEGKKYFLMANTNRPVMRLDYEDIANFKETITDTVSEFGVATGVPYDNLPMPYVFQMDTLDSENVVYVQRTASGEMVLRSRPTKWM